MYSLTSGHAAPARGVFEAGVHHEAGLPHHVTLEVPRHELHVGRQVALVGALAFRILRRFWKRSRLI